MRLNRLGAFKINRFFAATLLPNFCMWNDVIQLSDMLLGVLGEKFWCQ